MLHHMKLQPKPFAQIRRGEKTIELRLYDPKRQRIKVGDNIEFSSIQDKSERIRARVLALHRFQSFAELYQELPLGACGYNNPAEANPADMEQYYSADEQKKYGVIGIEVERINWKDAQLEKTSRYISLILRHRPEVAGITLDKNGWANVSELIKGVNKTHHLTMELLDQIVDTDEKQRYSYNADKTMIRANQGHSIEVDVELSPATPPEKLWHGTSQKYVESIECSGLLSQSRLFVHLSTDYPTAITVGRRHGEPVVYSVDAAQMQKDGYIFYRSVNNVWLTKYVPTIYLHKEN